jgi:hypothetical protein
VKKILVCGGRDFKRWGVIAEALRAHMTPGDKNVLLIHGGCDGADKFAADWADCNGIHTARVDALWEWYREKGNAKAAGPIRNGVMLALAPDLVIAFPGGTGTANMCKQAEGAGIRIVRITEAVTGQPNE